MTRKPNLRERAEAAVRRRAECSCCGLRPACAVVDLPGRDPEDPMRPTAACNVCALAPRRPVER